MTSDKGEKVSGDEVRRSEVTELVHALLTGSLVKNGVPTQVLSISGSPKAGKTTLCYETFISPDNAERVRHGRSFLIVSHRLKADELSNRAVTAVGNSVVSRPVKTLVALAFDTLARDRQARNLTPPKLLDGAEQDQLIRSVLGHHLHHVRVGDDVSCSTCSLLKKYFSLREEKSSSRENPAAPQTTEDVFAQMMTSSFAAQLRDMFARLSELHFRIDSDADLRDCEKGFDQDPRQCVEWDLAVALRVEYAREVSQRYPDEFRVDNAFVLVAAEDSIQHAREGDGSFQLPEVVIVDDSQELTLAGFSFLQALVSEGTKVLLVGNDDESVQTFRGAYPEVLSVLEAVPDGMNALQIDMPPRLSATSYAAAVASRVSQSIGSVMVNEVPIPKRPGKLVVPDAQTRTPDGSLQGRLFRSSAEELDDLVWNVKDTKLRNPGLEWRDLEVIAHDNATLQMIGHRFETENIPVSYSSVSRPLKEEPVVQGLLALLSLVDLAQRAEREDLTSETAAALVEQLKRAANSPLFTVPTAWGGERPLRLQRLTAAVASLAVLEAMASAQSDENILDDAASRFTLLHQAWVRLRGDVDNDSDAPIGVNGLFSLLVLGDQEVRDVLSGMIDSILSRGRRQSDAAHTLADDDVAALMRLIDVVRTAAAQKGEGESPVHVYETLWFVWDACSLAQVWQERALSATVEGRTANRLLDTVIRLFNHASAVTEDETLADFVERISSLDIEADSLAKVAPQEDAVSVATPAGASGVEKKYVWIPSLQQDVWPNLTPRNTLFGAEVLADTVLSGRLHRATSPNGDSESDRGAVLDSRRIRLATLYSEMKSFLVALTRASVRVTVSAVLSDTAVPSEFLLAFLPELFGSTGSGESSAQAFTQVGGPSLMRARIPAEGAVPDVGGASEAGTDLRGGLDTSERGLVAIARARLTRHLSQGSTTPLPPEVADAVKTLAYLARQGVQGADPQTWGFVDVSEAEETERDDAEASPESLPVTLSPSSVDQLWRCPLKWAMENKYNGPRSGNAATSFGTLIHGCAEEATQLGLDRSASFEELRDHMLSHFKQTRAQQTPSDKVADLYTIAQQDRKAAAVLENIATYFVESRNPLYGIDTQREKPVKNELPPAGALTGVEAEKSFRAQFSLRSILPMVEHALTGASQENGKDAHTLSAEVAAALSALADGFDADFSQKAVITLSGRIDRLEYRERRGNRIVDVVDYKTGKKHTGSSVFSDLQLVCYQLGLLFTQDPNDSVTVERSVLFDVEAGAAPASAAGAIEAAYQPALFESREAFNEHFTPRPRAPHIGSLFKETDPYPVAFEAMNRLEEAAAGNETLMWCLSMIARIFYAAGYKQSDHFVPKRGPACTFCAFKGICPAWPEVSQTVYGPSHGGQAHVGRAEK